MFFQIQISPTTESMYRTAFLEQMRGYDPKYIGLVFGPDDLIDPDGPIAMSNLPIATAHLRLLNAVRYVDGTQLWPVPGTTGTDHLPTVNTVGFKEESGVAEASQSD